MTIRWATRSGYFIRLALRQETWLGDFLTMETYY